MKWVIFILTITLIPLQALAQDSVPPDVAERVWKVIETFEGQDGYQSVSTDFDCQGMSVGIAQWNIGKSFDSVKSIIFSNTEKDISSAMPTYGKRFMVALKESKDATMKLVRSMQIITSPKCCDSNCRKASWNADGKRFKSELRVVLRTEPSIKQQQRLRENIFRSGWSNAQQWAKTNRGKDAIPTAKEVAYFVDMQNFNGGGFSKFGISYKMPTPSESAKLSEQSIRYLESASEDFLLHKAAARRNAKLLKPETLSENERALFGLSYAIADKLSAPHSRQFRLTTINRRAVILFGAAFYADSDKAPRRVYLDKGV